MIAYMDVKRALRSDAAGVSEADLKALRRFKIYLEIIRTSFRLGIKVGRSHVPFTGQFGDREFMSAMDRETGKPHPWTAIVLRVGHAKDGCVYHLRMIGPSIWPPGNGGQYDIQVHVPHKR